MVKGVAETKKNKKVKRKKEEDTSPTLKREKVTKWINIAVAHFTDADVTYSSAVITYYMLLSLFPLIIALGNVLTLFKINPDTILAYLNVIIPDTLQGTTDSIISNLLTGGSGGMFSISAIGLIWAASKGIGYIQKCMDKVYGVEPQNNFILKRGLGLVVVMALLLLMVLFVIVLSVGQVVLNALAETFPLAETLNTYFNNFKWPVSVVVVFVVLLLAYMFIPHVKLRLRDVWPGTLLGVVGILLLTQLFSIYVRFAANSLNSYDVLVTFVLLMLWMNFSAIIILCGSVLNATLYEYQYGKAVAQEGKIDKYFRTKIEKWIVKLARKKKFANVGFLQKMAQKAQKELEEEDMIQQKK